MRVDEISSENVQEDAVHDVEMPCRRRNAAELDPRARACSSVRVPTCALGRARLLLAGRSSSTRSHRELRYKVSEPTANSSSAMREERARADVPRHGQRALLDDRAEVTGGELPHLREDLLRPTSLRNRWRSSGRKSPREGQAAFANWKPPIKDRLRGYWPTRVVHEDGSDQTGGRHAHVNDRQRRVPNRMSATDPTT